MVYWHKQSSIHFFLYFFSSFFLHCFFFFFDYILYNSQCSGGDYIFLMSVVRASYRRILKQCQSLSRIFPDPNDLCFAFFGVLTNRAEFLAGGYGDSPSSIARRCFERPLLQEGDKNSLETVESRLACSFDVLRRLQAIHAIGNTRALATVEPRRKICLVENANGAVESRIVNADSEERDTSTSASSDAATGQHKPNKTTFSVQPSSPSSTSETKEEPSPSPLSTPPRAAEFSVSDNHHKEDVLLCRGTFLIQRGKNQRWQKFSRHTIVMKNESTFPSYPYLIPPEPLYPKNMRVEFHFPLVHDILLCMSATSRLLCESISQDRCGPRKEGARHTRAVDKKMPPHTFQSSFSRSATTALAEAMQSIPVSTITLTDFVEVEVWTRFVCTNSPLARGFSMSNKGNSFDIPTSSDGTSSFSASSASNGAGNVFVYYVLIRNKSEPVDEEGWHIQILSQHFVFIDSTSGRVVETGRPGLGGNFPMLKPGESHVYEGGTSISSGEGIVRGTLQVNAFSKNGRMRAFDVALSPTRLSAADSMPSEEQTRTADKVKKASGGGVQVMI